jgi:hypothetical protein
MPRLFSRILEKLALCLLIQSPSFLLLSYLVSNTSFTLRLSPDKHFHHEDSYDPLHTLNASAPLHNRRRTKLFPYVHSMPLQDFLTYK